METFIKHISYYLPEKILDNKALNLAHPEWSVEKISSKTGIKVRHIAGDDEFSSTLAFRAAEKLFDDYKIDRSTIDFLILCTQSPDYFLPTTACILQDQLRLSKNIGAFDFNLGCSGFVYGLGIAKGLIASEQAKNILLITAETYSKFIHPNDKNNKTIFGDAAAATLISNKKGTLSSSIQNFAYGTDGSGAEFLIVKNGGMRNRIKKGHDNIDENGNIKNDDNLFMDGKAIFNFTAFEVPKLIKQTLSKQNLDLSDIDLFIFHQANEFMLNTIRKRIKIKEEKFFMYMENSGNTVSSTIPIALSHAIKENRIKKQESFIPAFEENMKCHFFWFQTS